MSLPTVTKSAANTAFARVVKLLRDDTGPLGMQSVLWVTPGDPKWDDPLPAGKLAVRLTPELSEPEAFCNRPAGVRVWRQYLTVHFEVRTPGYGFGDPADLWGAIVAALAAGKFGDFLPGKPAAGLDPTATYPGSFRVTTYFDA